MMTKNVRETAKDTLDFQKGAFACWWDAMSILQDQAALAVDKVLNQTDLISDEGRQVLSSWIGTCKNERERCRVYMEESFSAFEKQLARNTTGASAGPGESAAQAESTAPAPESGGDAVEEEKSSEAHEIKQSVQ
jgi:hypothetical protein